jgi:hypothetical protein
MIHNSKNILFSNTACSAAQEPVAHSRADVASYFSIANFQVAQKINSSKPLAFCNGFCHGRHHPLRPVQHPARQILSTASRQHSIESQNSSVGIDKQHQIWRERTGQTIVLVAPSHSCLHGRPNPLHPCRHLVHHL